MRPSSEDKIEKGEIGDPKRDDRLAEFKSFGHRVLSSIPKKRTTTLTNIDGLY
jgi:hypothetical protein